MYDVYMNAFDGFPDVSIKDIIVETESGVSLAPASLDLVGVEPYLYSIDDRLTVLKESLKPVEKEYNHILIDTPPSMGQFVLNGFIAADRIIINLDNGIFAQKGIDNLKAIFEDIKEITGRRKSADMAIITKTGDLHETKSSFQEIAMIIKKMLGQGEKEENCEREREIESMLSSFAGRTCSVPYDYNIIKAQLKGLPISHLFPDSPATAAYRDIAEIISAW
jgi:chromosome partitioning protein